MSDTRDKYINIIYRMTGYDEDVINKFIQINKISDIGCLTLEYMHRVDVIVQLHHIEKVMKIKKLINLTKNPL